MDIGCGAQCIYLLPLICMGLGLSRLLCSSEHCLSPMCFAALSELLEANGLEKDILGSDGAHAVEHIEMFLQFYPRVSVYMSWKFFKMRFFADLMHQRCVGGQPLVETMICHHQKLTLDYAACRCWAFTTSPASRALR